MSIKFQVGHENFQSFEGNQFFLLKFTKNKNFRPLAVDAKKT
jgi:hypothetical protein